MLGKPKFKVGDRVTFVVKEEDKVYDVIGEVAIVDEWGTFFQDKEVSYDILVERSGAPYPTLYKHIIETHLSLVE